VTHGWAKARTAAVALAASVPPLLYLAFIWHYSVNALFWDDWDNVPIINGFLHGTISFRLLWSPHNEERLLVPNLLQGATLLFGHYNARHVILLSAVLFVASWLLVLLATKRSMGRLPGPLAVLLLGGVWFSVIDTQNALWAFQLAWYVVLFALVLLACVLSGPEIRWWQFVAAVAIAVLASYSSLQGLVLWVVGIVVIVWRLRGSSRQLALLSGLWVGTGAVVTALYFKGLPPSTGPTGGGSLGYALSQPWLLARFVVLEAGNVLPLSGGTHLGWLEFVGTLIVASALGVIAVSLIRDRATRSLPLPFYLVTFGLLCNVITAVGRMGFGLEQALATRYTMPNLVMVVGVGLFAWDLVTRPRPGAHVDRAQWTALQIGVGAAVSCAAVAQIWMGTSVGLPAARADHTTKVVGNQVVVNLDRIPESQRRQLVLDYVYGSPKFLPDLAAMARSDKVGVFAPPLYEHVRQLGPPSG
jgi:hypothetical protein